ncbi:hypothetical protein RSJ42_10345 [Methanosarcina hadiensis]|uniref:hypothetical protein n=1 Tax=Methanosarcina hadiensis TaxID=3078083 RepID=UPI003977B4E3
MTDKFDYINQNKEISPYSLFLGNPRHNAKTAKKQIYPIVKLGEKTTYSPERHVDSPEVIIKAQQLISRDGKSTNSLFNQIRNNGGIQNHLDFGGDVILSSIMPDRAIEGLTSETYAEIIDTLGIKYYLTPDGETYLREPEVSAVEINRMLNQTQALRDCCPLCVPIGLVKGCTDNQILYHLEMMQNMGIQRFCFHLADFFRGPDYVLQIAKRFAYLIRERTDELIIYGIGSKKHINSFRFVDGFATQSHYVKAYYGYRYEYGRWIRSPGRKVDRELVMHNLHAISSFVEDLRNQQELTPFLEEEVDGPLRNSTAEQIGMNYCTYT